MKIYGNKDLMDTLNIAFDEGIPALLIGQTGTGKNTILRHIAEKHQRADVIRLNLTGDTTVDDLIGHYQIKDQSTVWQDGSVTHAVREGHILVLDEVNAAQPEVLFALQSLLDDDRRLTLTSHDNSVVPAHANFRIFATMNPTSGYTGTKSMNKAFMSRFGVVVEVEYIDPKNELKLLHDMTPTVNPSDALIMVEVARLARERLNHEQLSFPVSTRDLIYWAQMTTKVKDLTRAFNDTIVNKADTDKKDLLELLRVAVADSENTAEYRRTLEERVVEYLHKLNQDEQTSRSVLREDADKMVTFLEQVERVVCDRDNLKREVTDEVNLTLKQSKAELKKIAEKLKAEAEALVQKEKDAYAKGKADAMTELYTKLGIQEQKND